MKQKKTLLNPVSKTRQDLSSAERQEMLTKYDKLVEPTQWEALEALRISQLMVCRLLREHEKATLLPAPINVGKKEEEWGTMR
ncbi:hypothetical protein MXB_2979, partial [Myxobolus squamalis]